MLPTLSPITTRTATHPLLGTLVAAGLSIALFAGSAAASGNAGRVVAAPANSKECARMVGDTREMLEETEVTADVDVQVEALIKTAADQCKASEFDGALTTMLAARKLLGG